MSDGSFIRSIIAGQLFREFKITQDGRILLDIPGGNLLYAATGFGIWENDAGLVSRIGENYPRDWLNEIESAGFDIRGIKILPESVDHRLFTTVQMNGLDTHDNPVYFFVQNGYKFPEALLGYSNPLATSKNIKAIKKTTLRPNDIPLDFLEASSVLICSMDFSSQTTLLASASNNHISSIILQSSNDYMNPINWDEIPNILNGLTVFITDEPMIRNLFLMRSNDLWDMAEKIASNGCEIVLIKLLSGSLLLYDHSSRKRWQVPNYPTKVVDTSGIFDALAGGFLAGFRKNYSPVEAASYGSISASLVCEGRTPFYALKGLKGLPDARLRHIQSLTRRF